MKIRADVAAMLQAGATYTEIRQQLGIGSNTTIARARKALRLPVPHRDRPRRTLQESYELYAKPYGDGHARWEGPWAGRMPQICHPGKSGRKESALRVAFRLQYGREPVGQVKPGCDEPQCVARRHVEDRPLRARTKATFDAIFGGPQ